jgi:hypothetical protein
MIQSEKRWRTLYRVDPEPGRGPKETQPRPIKMYEADKVLKSFPIWSIKNIDKAVGHLLEKRRLRTGVNKMTSWATASITGIIIVVVVGIIISLLPAGGLVMV